MLSGPHPPLPPLSPVRGGRMHQVEVISIIIIDKINIKEPSPVGEGAPEAG